MGWRSKTESNTTRDPIENILGRSSMIQGDLSADGAFRIDGTIEGSVTSRAAVVIGESGVVSGEVLGRLTAWRAGQLPLPICGAFARSWCARAARASGS